MTMRVPRCLLLTIALALTGCDSDHAPEIQKLAEERGALTEEHDEGLAVTWVVAPNGSVRAAVTREGEPVKKLSGHLRVKGVGDDNNVQHELIAKGALLEGEIGKLREDVTDIRYDLEADGERLRGTLHLPDGGTRELADTAKDKPELEGPHGGVVEQVGDDIIEIVGNERTGEVRIYLLDEEGDVIETEERKMFLLVGGKTSEHVVLEAHPDEGYFSGKLPTKSDPVKLTVVVHHGHDHHVVLCGYHPRKTIVVGRSAPVVKVFVARDFHPRGRAQVKVKVADRPKTQVKIKSHGKKGSKISVKVH